MLEYLHLMYMFVLPYCF